MARVEAGRAAQRRQALAAEQGRQHGAHDGEDLLRIAAERRPTGELHARIEAKLDEAIASRFRVQRSQLDSWARSADAERRGEQAANAQRSASYAEALRLARQGYEVRNC